MKTKHFLLTFVLVTISLITAAQDKYELLTIAYEASGLELVISVDGKQLIKEKTTLIKAENTQFNNNPLLKKVNEYQEQNWEVISFNTISVAPQGSLVYFSYLRKKKTDNK